MPIDASIPLSYKPIDAMANLSSLLDVNAKSLSLDKARQTFDADVARVKADSSTAQSGAATAEITLGERKALQQALADPSQYTGADGKLDYNKALPLIMRVAPTTGMDHVKNMMATQEQATNSDKAILGLGAEKMGQLGNFAYSLRGLPQNVQEQGVSSLEQHMPMLAEHLPYLQKSMKQARDSGGQEGVDRLLSQFGRQMQSVPNQQTMSATNPMAIQTNQGTQLFNNKPDSAAPMGPMGSPFTPPDVAVRNNTGGTGFANPATKRYTDVSGTNNSTPLTLPTNESNGTRDASLALRPQANEAASNAPSQAFNANQIIKYADSAITGTGKDKIAAAAAMFPGVPFTGEKATDTQLLGHAIAQQTTTLANQAGLAGSNAKLALSEQMTADGKWTPEAIKSSSRVMRAIGDSGAILYNKGMENAAKSGDPFAFRDFRNNWSQAASAGGIDGIRLYDARRHASADPDGMKQTVKSMGGVDSPRYKEALKSMDRLGQLVRGE